MFINDFKVIKQFKITITYESCDVIESGRVIQSISSIDIFLINQNSFISMNETHISLLTSYSLANLSSDPNWRIVWASLKRD